MNDWLEACLQLLFPPRCPACHAYVERRGSWCDNCLGRTLRLRRLPLPAEMAARLDSAWALAAYQGVLRRLIHALKFHGKMQVLPQLQALVGAADWPPEITAADLAVPVPLFPRKQKERGFNQAVSIFEAQLASWQLPSCQMLQRVRATRPQYGLSAAERRQNIAGAFALSVGISPDMVQGRRILLLDDIFTTGATLSACAKVLKQAGAGRVTALVLASDRN